MLHKTHSQVGLTFGAGAVVIAQNQGIIPSNVSGDFNALFVTTITAATIIISAKFGSYYPDLDHHNSYITTKNSLTKFLHSIIRLTGAYLSSHRSRLTHSFDGTGITIGAIWFGLHTLLNTYVTTNYISESLLNSFMLKVDELLPVIIISLLIGVWSHIVADLLTTEGAYLSILSKKRFSLVPGNIRVMGTKPLQSTFGTSSPWEGLVNMIAKGGFYLLLALIVVQTFQPSITTLVE